MDVLLRGGDVERAAGDVDRVLGGFTATESATEAAAEDASEVDDPVRRREAASLGRMEDVGAVFGLRLMRAAS